MDALKSAMDGSYKYKVKKGFDLILNLMYGNGQDMKNIFYQFMFGLISTRALL